MSHHLYDVGFLPNHVLIQAESSIQIPGYQLMFQSPTFCSHLRVYNETKQASQKGMIPLTKVKSSARDLLSIDTNQVSYIGEEVMRDALEPRFVHVGKARSSFSLLSEKDEDTIKINHEVIRTRAFFNFFSTSKLKKEFVFGHIRLPPQCKGKPYSLYGHSLNDLCIINKTKYKSGNQITGGVMMALNENPMKEEDSEDDEEIRMYDKSIIGRSSSSARVLEFKRERFDVDQTAKEMLKSCGDLVAKVLLEGNQVIEVNMYGLAVNYSTETALLVALYLNFIKCEANLVHSHDHEPVVMCQAMNWLLNCITLN